MDLGAYVKIDNLSEIMRTNGISVPRLRGLRMMKDEKPLSEEEITEQVRYIELSDCDDLCCSIPRFAYRQASSPS